MNNSITTPLPSYFMEHLASPTPSALLEHLYCSAEIWSRISKTSPGLLLLKESRIILPTTAGHCRTLRGYLQFLIAEFACWLGADTEECKISEENTKEVLAFMEDEQKQLIKIIERYNPTALQNGKLRKYQNIVENGLLLISDLSDLDDINILPEDTAEQEFNSATAKQKSFIDELKNNTYVISNMRSHLQTMNSTLIDTVCLAQDYIIERLNYPESSIDVIFITFYVLAKVFSNHNACEEFANI